VILLLAAVAALTSEKQIERLTAHCDNSDLNVVYACIQGEHDKMEARLKKLLVQFVDRARREDLSDYNERRKYDPTYVFRNDGESTARAAEEAWFNWRDAQCKYETYDLFRDGASMAGSMYNECSMRLMLKRIDELIAQFRVEQRNLKIYNRATKAKHR
jgi:uncharacterized protein YecT (DUF1311 family)